MAEVSFDVTVTIVLRPECCADVVVERLAEDAIPRGCQ